VRGARPRIRGDERLILLLVAAPLLGSVACAIGPEVLDPAPEPMPDRLLPLTVGLAHEIEVRSESDRGVTVQTDVNTVFRRDLDANVFSDDTLRWGYVELRVTFDEKKVTGGGAALIAGSVVTLFVPAFLGAPFIIEERTLQSELAIYDSRRVPVRTYVLEGRVKYAYGLYNEQSAHRKARIEAAKQIMGAFRDRLSAELADVNGRLRRVGPIADPAPVRTPGGA
jgi:hypothetical protein